MGAVAVKVGNGIIVPGLSFRRSSGWFWSSAADVALNRRQPKTLALLSVLLVGGGGGWQPSACQWLPR